MDLVNTVLKLEMKPWRKKFNPEIATEPVNDYNDGVTGETGKRTNKRDSADRDGETEDGRER